MLSSIADTHGARHVETLTGFKWLARAAGDDLVYAYEEAIGHCVDPAAVRDKDGISAAVLCCDLAANRNIPEVLDDLARSHGVHVTAPITVRTDAAAAVMTQMRDNPPTTIAGVDVTPTEREDVLILAGQFLRLALRPSGTEPKVKCYIEIALPPTNDVAAARRNAHELSEQVRAEATALLQRGPN
jgi:phosphomannomutase